MKPALILVVVPTTGGPLVLRALKPRPGLPTSAAFAAGDYRPLPWSGDYARLAAEGGPLCRLRGVGPGPYELRLSGSFDAGRSWEVPVCLAHGLVAQGHRLTAEPSEANLVVWATGAVDLDLAVLPGDYALLDKIERSGDLLAQVKDAELAILLPDGPESAQAERDLRSIAGARPFVVLPSGSLQTAVDALARPVPSGVSTAPRRSSMRVAVAAALAVSLALLATLAAFYGYGPARQAEAPPAVVDATPAEPRTMPAASAKAEEPREETREEAQAAVIVEELIAPAGSSCRRVAFGADPPERRPVPPEAGGRLRASRLTANFCGLAFRPPQAGPRLAVGPELSAAALPPVRLPDGAQAYFLREGARQNLVYSVQAIPEVGSPRREGRLEHALVQ